MDYFITILVLALLNVILAVSLNLILGYAGLMSNGHGALFGVGAYGAALCILNFGLNFWQGMLCGIVMSMLLGLLTALPALRVKDEYVILLTLAIQMVFVSWTTASVELTGGPQGLMDIPPITLFGFTFVSAISFLPLAFVFTAICVALSWRITNSPFGRVLKAMRDDDVAILALGKNVLRFKVLVFVIAAGMAAVAGSLFAHYMGYLSPVSFSIDQSIMIIAMVVIGGSANIWGSVVGAILLTFITESMNFLPLEGSNVGFIRMIIYGLILVFFALFRRQGLIPEHMVFRKKILVPFSLSSRESDAVMQADDKGGLNLTKRSPGVALEIDNISKSFGGICATDNASLRLDSGKITALIGPNGAGKTTLFNLITGFLKPDGGKVYLQGKDITGMPPYKVANLGMTRYFQEVRIFPNISAIDNVLVACPKQSGEKFWRLVFRGLKVADEEKKNYQRAMTCLSFVGLEDKSWKMAGELSFGDQKLVALARQLATGSDVLLFDEVVSGIDPPSMNELLSLIRKLASYGKTICIIEHNLDVVKGVADLAYFLAEGTVIARGTPDELMADKKLTELYFGVGA